jgi:hypothetical protein
MNFSAVSLPAIDLAFDGAWRVLVEWKRPSRFATDGEMQENSVSD